MFGLFGNKELNKIRWQNLQETIKDLFKSFVNIDSLWNLKCYTNHVVCQMILLRIEIEYKLRIENLILKNNSRI